METIKLPSKKNADAPAPVPPVSSMTMEVAYVLFMDVVGYSKLRSMQQQADMQIELQNLVQSAPEVAQARRENKLIVRPTGDGMALIFLRDLVSPLRCAIQVHTQLKAREAEIRKRIGVPILLRMGIHTGPVFMTEDLNAQTDVAGEGVIIAQRVMDCGDAGHILLSDEAARHLLKTEPWPRYLTDLGECRVKHGVKVHLYNLYGRLDGPFCGNPAIPKKVQADGNAIREEAKKYQPKFFERHPAAKGWLVFFCLAAVIGGGGYTYWQKNPAFQNKVRVAWKGVTAPHRAPVETATTKSTGKTDKSTSKNQPKTQKTAVVPVDTTPLASVPDLVGRTWEDAQATAQTEGLNAKRGGSAYSKAQGEGIVFKQRPSAGTFLARGRAVVVFISKGDPPDPSLNLPPPPTDTEDPSTTDTSNKITGDGE